MKSNFTYMFLSALFMIVSVGTLQAAETSTTSQAAKKVGNVWMTADSTQYFTCPVMKGEGKVGQESGHSVVNGVTYYHCCPPCQAPFRQDPDKWLSELFLPANIKTVDNAGVKHFIDPVSQDEGTVDKKTQTLDRDGQRWYFTSKRTMKAFRKHPEKYISMK